MDFLRGRAERKILGGPDYINLVIRVGTTMLRLRLHSGSLAPGWFWKTKTSACSIGNPILWVRTRSSWFHCALRSGSNGWYVMVLSHYKAALFGSWRYWVVIEQYWIIHDDTGFV